MRSRVASRHHCGPIGPYCTRNRSLSNASAIPSTWSTRWSAGGAGKGRREARSCGSTGEARSRQQCALVAIREGVAVEDRAREGDPDSDVRRRPCDPLRLVGEPVREGVVAVLVAPIPAWAIRPKATAASRSIDGRPPVSCDPALEGDVKPRRGRTAACRSRGRGRAPSPVGRGGPATRAAGAIRRRSIVGPGRHRPPPRSRSDAPVQGRVEEPPNCGAARSCGPSRMAGSRRRNHARLERARSPTGSTWSTIWSARSLRAQWAGAS